MDQNQAIDLRPLILALLKNWYILLLGLILSVVVAAVWYTRTPAYKATAQVAIINAQTTANFDSRIERNETQLDQATLGTALTNVAVSSAVAQNVIDRMGADLPNDLRNPASLLGLMNANVDNRSNLVLLNVSYTEEHLPIKIVNAWTDAFVSQANEIYGLGSNTLVLKSVQEQYTGARQDYERSEQALADSVAKDNSIVLEQRVAEYQAVVDNLRDARTSVISQTASADVVQFTALISTYASLQWSGQAAVISQQNQHQIAKLQIAYSSLRRLEQLRQEVVALREHLAKGGDAESAELALQLLKAQVFAASEGMPTNLQVQISVTGKASVVDADSIISTIDTRIEALKADITSQAAALNNGSAFVLPDSETIAAHAIDPELQKQFDDLLSQNLLLRLVGSALVTNTSALALSPDDAIVRLQQRVQELQAELQAARAKNFVVEQERDIAKERYVALGHQISELLTTRAVGGQVVSPASRPLGATKESISRPLLKAGAIGIAVLLLLVIVILFREFVPAWLAPVSRKSPPVEATRSEPHA